MLQLKGKRLLACLLALIMVFTLLPATTTTLAAGDPYTITAKTATDLGAGKYYMFVYNDGSNQLALFNHVYNSYLDDVGVTVTAGNQPTIRGSTTTIADTIWLAEAASGGGFYLKNPNKQQYMHISGSNLGLSSSGSTEWTFETNKLRSGSSYVYYDDSTSKRVFTFNAAGSELQLYEVTIAGDTIDLGANGTATWSNGFSILKPVTVKGTGTINVSNAVTVSQPIAVASGANVTIKGSGTDAKLKAGTNGNYMFNVSGADLTFENITLEGNGKNVKTDYRALNVANGGVTLGDKAVIQKFGMPAATNESGLSARGYGLIHLTTNGAFTMESNSAIRDCSASSGVVRVDGAGAHFQMNGGEINNCDSRYSTKEGSAVYVNAGGTMTMTGGTITGCGKETNAPVNGTIYMNANAGAVTITGGSIKDNKAELGGAIYQLANNTATITVGGTAQLTGNTATALSGATESNIYLAGTQSVAISSAKPLTGNAQIGVYKAGTPTADGLLVATGAKQADLKYFRSDLPTTAGLIFKNNGIYLSTSAAGLQTIYLKSGGNGSKTGEDKDNAVATLATAYAKVAPGGTIVVMDKITVSNSLNITKSVTITGKDGDTTYLAELEASETISPNLMGVDAPNVNLTIKDLTLTRKATDNISGGTNPARLIYFRDTTSFTGTSLRLEKVVLQGQSGEMAAGNAASGNATLAYAPVTVPVTLKDVKIKDGSIRFDSNNIAEGKITTEGTVYIRHSTITRAASYTSDVLLDVGDANGNVTLTNTTLDGNRANVTATAPLVRVYGGTFTLGNGAILRNNNNPNTAGNAGGTPETEKWAGGLMVSGGTAIIAEGSQITGNTGHHGGGIHVNGTANIEFTGGTITGNTTNFSGSGAVSLYEITTAKMEGPVNINGNTDGNLYIRKNANNHIDVTGALTGSIGVTTEAQPDNNASPKTFVTVAKADTSYSSGLTAADAAKFTHDKADGNFVFLHNSEAVLGIPKIAYVNASGSSLTATLEDETKPYPSIKEAYNALTTDPIQGGHIVVLENMSAGTNTFGAANKTVVLRGKTDSIALNASSSAFSVTNGTVTMKDLTIKGPSAPITTDAASVIGVTSGTLNLGTNLTVTGFTVEAYNACIAIAAGGTINVNGATFSDNTITGKSTDRYNSSILQAGSGGKLNLNSGSVTNNKLYDYASAVALGVVNRTEFKMTGGSISGNPINGTNRCYAVYMATGAGTGADAPVIKVGGTAGINDNKNIAGEQRNIFIESGNKPVEIVAPLTGTKPQIGIYSSATINDTTDALVATGAIAADLAHLRSDRSGTAGLIFCDGTDTHAPIGYHTPHTNGNIYLSVANSTGQARIGGVFYKTPAEALAAAAANTVADTIEIIASTVTPQIDATLNDGDTLKNNNGDEFKAVGDNATISVDTDGAVTLTAGALEVTSHAGSSYPNSYAHVIVDGKDVGNTNKFTVNADSNTVTVVNYDHIDIGGVTYASQTPGQTFDLNDPLAAADASANIPAGKDASVKVNNAATVTTDTNNTSAITITNTSATTGEDTATVTVTATGGKFTTGGVTCTAKKNYQAFDIAADGTVNISLDKDDAVGIETSSGDFVYTAAEDGTELSVSASGGVILEAGSVSMDGAGQEITTATTPPITVKNVDGNGAVTVDKDGNITLGAGAKVEVEINGQTVTYTGPMNFNPNNPPSTGGGRSGSATVGGTPTISSSANGTASVSPKNAAAGTKVTLSTKPNAGYRTASVIITDKNGNPVEVTMLSDGSYSYIQPKDLPVTIKVVYEEIKEGEGVDTPGSDVSSDTGVPFNDVTTDDWFLEDVKFAFENNLMLGMDEGVFDPYADTTRGMIVTILWRLEGEPSGLAGNPFDDVYSGDWYNAAVTWAAENNIVDGYGDGKFGPTDNITREQIAAIIFRYAVYKGYDVSAMADLSGFIDANEISSWALQALSMANATELINGRGNGVLDPLGNAKRCEVAAILHRFVQNIAD